MKKAKIMLLAITVLAVVGGALAFKARTTVGDAILCTTITADCGLTGIAITQRTIEPAVDNPTLCYTVVAEEAQCATITAPFTGVNLDN